MSFLESKATTSSDLLALSAGVDSKLALKLSTPSALPSESSVLTISPSGSTTTSSVTATELGLLSGASSNVQVQLDNKSNAHSHPYVLSSSVSTFGAALMNDAAAINGRATLGLGTAATANSGAFISSSNPIVSGSMTAQYLQINSTQDYTGSGGHAIFKDSNNRETCIGGLGIFRRDSNSTADFRINYLGYNGGHTQFRNCDIFNGKGDYLAAFAGQNRNLTMYATDNNITLQVQGNTKKLYFNGSLKHGSDDRLKHNEESITDALGTLKKLDVRKYLKSGKMYDADTTLVMDVSGEYTNLEDGDSVNPEIGLIAQQVEQIPELAFCVDTPEPDENSGLPRPKHVDYNSLFALHIKATQELEIKVAALEARVASLEGAS